MERFRTGSAKAWGGPIVVKGILTGEDARLAVDEGAASGRGLESRGTAARWRIADAPSAAGGRRGGERAGGSAVRRRCQARQATSPRRCLWGHEPVLVGRAYAYGLGAGGGPGVARSIEILRSDLTRTLKLLGCAGSTALDRSYIDVPSAWTHGRAALTLGPLLSSGAAVHQPTPCPDTPYVRMTRDTEGLRVN